MDDITWYARMRNIPGMRYEPPIAIDPDHEKSSCLIRLAFSFAASVRKRSLRMSARPGRSCRTHSWMR